MTCLKQFPEISIGNFKYCLVLTEEKETVVFMNKENHYIGTNLKCSHIVCRKEIYEAIKIFQFSHITFHFSHII